MKGNHSAERQSTACVSIPEGAGEASPTWRRDRFPDLLVLQRPAKGCDGTVLDDLDVIDRLTQYGRGLTQTEFLQISQKDYMPLIIRKIMLQSTLDLFEHDPFFYTRR